MRFEIGEMTHGIGYIFREELCKDNNILFASALIKHPKSNVLEITVDSDAYGNDKVRQQCAEVCDKLCKDFSELQFSIADASSLDGSRASTMRKAVLVPA